MDLKKTILFASIFLMFFAAVAVGGIMIYINRPNWLGIDNELARELNRKDSIEEVRIAEEKRNAQIKKDTTKRTPVPLRNVEIDEVVEISPNHIKYLEEELNDKNNKLTVLDKEKNNLTQQSNKLQDTIKLLNSKLKTLADSIKSVQSKAQVQVNNEQELKNRMETEKKKLDEINKKYATKEKEVNDKNTEIQKTKKDIAAVTASSNELKKQNKILIDSLQKAKRDATTKDKRIDSLQKIYKKLQEDYEKKKDSLIIEEYKRYAGMYNSAKPKNVAKVLEGLEDIHAANILARMQKKKAGQVITVMTPEKVASILKHKVEIE